MSSADLDSRFAQIAVLVRALGGRRRSRIGWGAGLAAVAIVLALAVGLTAEAGPTAREPVLAVGLSGALATAVALIWPPALTAGLLLPAVAYAIVLVDRDPALDADAALVAGALVVVAGLVDWSLERTSTSPDEPGRAWRRLAWITLTALAAYALARTLLAVVDVARTDGVAIELIGGVAAIALLVALARPER